MSSEIDLSQDGRRIRVWKNDRHPEQMLWIDVDAQQFFLGVLLPGMRRRDVKLMAERFLRAHPEHLRKS